MSDHSLICVIDANVALKLFFEQPGSDKADALFARLETDGRARFYVPDFFYAECASVLANYVRQTKYSAKEARQDMAELRDLALHVVPTSDLATDALNLALAQGISGYDAFYLALSQQVNAPLITADEKLVRAVASKSFQVFSLVVFSLPA